MLEKALCKIIVSRQRVIIFLEADFNVLHKIIYNQHILSALEQQNLIPTEIVSGHKSQAAIHVAVNKKLMSEIYNQVKTQSKVVSVNVTNCYDRVAYHFASLAVQHFGVNTYFIRVPLKVIQSMAILLWNSFGTSSTS